MAKQVREPSDRIPRREEWGTEVEETTSVAGKMVTPSK